MWETQYHSRLFKPWLDLKRQAKQHLNPAATALLIQVLSFGLVCISHYLAGLCGLQLSLRMMFALQALFAIGLSCVFSMAIWWHVMHGLFPLLVGVMLKHPISQAYYLYGLLLSSAVFWSTFRSQVPYFPSGSQVPDLLKKILPSQKPVRMIDIGSGLGGPMIQLAKAMPQSSFSGIEIAPLPWLVSLIRSKIFRTSAQFLYGDYRNLNFADYDVIYAYLSPAVMSAVWQKAVTEMAPGSLLISNEFEISDKPAHMTLEADPQSPKLYVWCM